MELFIVYTPPNEIYTQWKLTPESGSPWSNNKRLFDNFVHAHDHSQDSFWERLFHPFQQPSPAPLGGEQKFLITEVAVESLKDKALQVFFIDGAKQRLLTMWKVSSAVEALWTEPQLFEPEPPFDISTITAGTTAKGLLHLFALSSNGQLFSTWKTSLASDASWAPWVRKPDIEGRTKETKIAVGRTHNGQLNLWQVVEDRLMVSKKGMANIQAPWSKSRDFLSTRGNSSFKPTDVAVGPLSDDRLQLFFINNHQQLFTMWELPDDSVKITKLPEVQASGNLDLEPPMMAEPFVMIPPDHKGWTAPTLFDPALPEEVGQITAMAAGRHADGVLQLFAMTTGRGTITTWKESSDPNAPWMPWEIPPPPEFIH